MRVAQSFPFQTAAERTFCWRSPAVAAPRFFSPRSPILCPSRCSISTASKPTQRGKPPDRLRGKKVGTIFVVGARAREKSRRPPQPPLLIRFVDQNARCFLVDLQLFCTRNLFIFHFCVIARDDERREIVAAAASAAWLRSDASRRRAAAARSSTANCRRRRRASPFNSAGATFTSCTKSRTRRFSTEWRASRIQAKWWQLWGRVELAKRLMDGLRPSTHLVVVVRLLDAPQRAFETQFEGWRFAS